MRAPPILDLPSYKLTSQYGICLHVVFCICIMRIQYNLLHILLYTVCVIYFIVQQIVKRFYLIFYLSLSFDTNKKKINIYSIYKLFKIFYL